MHKETVIKITLIVFVLLWMITVFIFSSQDGTQTLKTSGAFIDKIKETIKNETPNPKDEQIKTDNVKQQVNKHSSKTQNFVRKNAHYFLYFIGGIILSAFFYVLTKNKIKTCIFSFLVGVIYAMSDEFHQRFVQGRTASITDVLIDSLGILTGIALFMILINIILNWRNKTNEKTKIIDE